VKLQHEHKTASTNIKRTQPCKRQQLPTGKPTPKKFHNGPAGRNTELQETTQNAANTQKKVKRPTTKTETHRIYMQP
jgi:hypothetical protein